MSQNRIHLANLNLGGIADSDIQGLGNSMAEIVGLDIHGEPGIIKVNQALMKDSGIIVDSFVKAIVSCSDGSAYHFSSTTGKIWSRTSAGVWALEATNANGACQGAYEYDGWIYYASATKLGRWQKGTAWTTRVDDFGTFLAGDNLFHPMFEKNGVLYIGDGKFIAQVNLGVFTDNALDLPGQYRICSLNEIYNDLVIGTIIANNVAKSKIFRWDTIAISWSTDDEVPEIGVKAFIPMDNAVVPYCGEKGNFYWYDGERLIPFKRIKGMWSVTRRGTVFYGAGANYQGIPMFGMSNENDNPTLEGVYSFGSYSSGYPRVLNLEYPISTGAMNNVKIGAMAGIRDNLLVSWENGGVVTMTIANPCVVTWVNHCQKTGTTIMFTTTAGLPTGITASTYYYIRVINVNTFYIYDTYDNAVSGGTTGRIVTTGTQSGVHTGVNYGVDKIESETKCQSAYFTTRIINPRRELAKDFAIQVAYRSNPKGCAIIVEQSTNYGEFIPVNMTDDTDRKMLLSATELVSACNSLQIRVRFAVNINTAPEIESLDILF